MTDAISTLLQDITAGTGIRSGIYTDDAVLDATVPGWRFQKAGSEEVRGQLTHWFADPGSLEELHRSPLPGGGELVTFTLRWVEEGVEHAAHQAHVVQLSGDRISHHELWCGGRWSADLLEEMASAS